MDLQRLEKLERELEVTQGQILNDIQNWRRWWNELRELGKPRLGEMGTMLDQIREHIRLHFEHEERDGCLAVIQEDGPQLAGRARRLADEHVLLLNELDNIIDKLRSSQCDQMCWGEAGAAFEAFLKELDAHEAAETKLVQEAASESTSTRPKSQ